MTSRKGDVSFKSPPLVEVSISVQFEPLNSFHIGTFGVIWSEFKEDYPNISHENPIEHKVEKFGVIERVNTPKFKFVERAELPRVQMTSNSLEYMIQFQEDRFILSWRHVEGSIYPRHDKFREKFFNELEKFKSLVTEELVYDQIELNYVNHIDASEQAATDVFLELLHNSQINKRDEIESFSINMKQIMLHGEDKVGRIYTSVEKAIRERDDAELFVLRFVTRAHPFTNSDKDICPTIELMRNKINASFESLTTTKMHSLWNREV